MANYFGKPGDYSAKEQYKLINEFDTTFWSGLDVQVYAGNIWLKQCIQLNYQILENVRVFTHYNHYVPTRFRHGTRMIQGELSINFTRDSYMISLLQRLQETDPEKMMLPRNTGGGTSADGTQTGDPILYGVYGGGVQQSGKLATEDFNADQARDFILNRKRMLEQEERRLSSRAPTIPQNAGIFQTLDNGFDINIVFGAFLTNPMTLKYVADEQDYYADGATVPDLRPNPSPIGTGLKLVGVEIQGCARSMADDGRPLVETYSFLAKDIRILQQTEVSDFPEYSSVFDRAQDEQLGPSPTLETIQEFLRAVSGL